MLNINLKTVYCLNKMWLSFGWRQHSLKYPNLKHNILKWKVLKGGAKGKMVKTFEGKESSILKLQ